LLALKSCAVSSRVVLKCRDFLQELTLSNRVRLVWVPGHCGIHGNEEADALLFRWHLRVSSEGSGIGYSNHTVPHGTCRQSRMWLKKPNPGLTYLLPLIYLLPRSKLKILVGLITGHCLLNKDMHNLGLIDEPICIACGMEDESAFHLLCNCPSRIFLKMRTFSIPILTVEEYEGADKKDLDKKNLGKSTIFWIYKKKLH
jgi:hypothetical protein